MACKPDKPGQKTEEPPGGLSGIALEQFDELVAQDALFFEASCAESSQDRGYDFELRVIPAFLRKPILSAGDPRRKDAGGPLSNPEEPFVLAEINSTHILQFNKYCVYRPQFILHPKQFAQQTDDLDAADFAAAWTALNQLEGSYVIFFNCGVDAGSSQGHKHLQLIPKPASKAFTLFPDKPEMQLILILASRSEKEHQPPRPIAPPASLHVPFACRLLALPPDASSATVLAHYIRLMDWLRQQDYIINPDIAYNVVLTREWICVIPRRHAGREGINANAMGMMGLVWVKDKKERDGWERLGWTHHLEAVGVPPI